MTLTDDLDFDTIRDIYVKYESSITYHSKAMANVKDFVDKQKGQMDTPKTICQ